MTGYTSILTTIYKPFKENLFLSIKKCPNLVGKKKRKSEAAKKEEWWQKKKDMPLAWEWQSNNHMPVRKKKQTSYCSSIQQVSFQISKKIQKRDKILVPKTSSHCVKIDSTDPLRKQMREQLTSASSVFIVYFLIATCTEQSKRDECDTVKKKRVGGQFIDPWKCCAHICGRMPCRRKERNRERGV